MLYDKMNILHIESSYNWGGQEYRTCIEVLWLNEHNHRAWLACDPKSALYDRGQELGVPLVPIKMRRFYNVRSIIKLFLFCRDNEVQVINTHSSRDSWMCFPLHVAGFSVVRSRHVTSPIKANFRRSFIYRHGCVRIIATAQIIQDMLVKNNGVEKEKVDVVGEGVDLGEYHPDVDGTTFREEFGIPLDAPLVGIIGMMRSDKGHRYFLDAAFEILEKDPKIFFVMVGEAARNQQIEQQLRDRIQAHPMGRNVIMTGYRWDIPNVIGALDVVVVASTGVEAQSRVIPQAFASRKAVVATSTGGIPELIQHHVNGLLVPPGDGKPLAAAIKQITDDIALRERLAASANSTARSRLSLNRMMELTLDCYQRAINSKNY